MALTRERRTALAELQVAVTRLQTAKAAMRDENESHESLIQLMAYAGECIDRAMAALKE